MEENKELTVRDVLKDVIDILGGIMVPVKEVNSIGMPIARAINGIRMCLDSFDRAEAEQNEQAEDAPAQAEEEQVKEDA